MHATQAVQQQAACLQNNTSIAMLGTFVAYM
jgi:hypothetical protein